MRELFHDNIKELEEIIMEKVRELKDVHGEPEQEIRILETIFEVYNLMKNS